ncbi:hypothetical protein, partial [Mesorhizobium amorphae]|uniref:hypothetical protein n=1 Tax=Mesorhizobium amorphae TaxID=71433 RepID=UPI0024E1111F
MRGSNKKTLIHQKPRVQGGKCVKKGQILADGAATVDGELALGKNILVAYMPWEGYNSEDAVLISERLIYEDIFTSFSSRKYSCTNSFKLGFFFIIDFSAVNSSLFVDIC